MTQDEIIRMAREACAPNQTFNSDEEWVKRFAALVAAHEREACAKVCETEWSTLGQMEASSVFAAAIRARNMHSLLLIDYETLNDERSSRPTIESTRA